MLLSLVLAYYFNSLNFYQFGFISLVESLSFFIIKKHENAERRINLDKIFLRKESFYGDGTVGEGLSGDHKTVESG
jgi:hypothetical protein